MNLLTCVYAICEMFKNCTRNWFQVTVVTNSNCKNMKICIKMCLERVKNLQLTLSWERRINP